MKSVSMRLLHIGEAVPVLKIDNSMAMFPEAKVGDTIEARLEEGQYIRRFLNGKDITFLCDNYHGDFKWYDL